MDYKKIVNLNDLDESNIKDFTFGQISLDKTFIQTIGLAFRPTIKRIISSSFSEGYHTARIEIGKEIELIQQQTTKQIIEVQKHSEDTTAKIKESVSKGLFESNRKNIIKIDELEKSNEFEISELRDKSEKEILNLKTKDEELIADIKKENENNILILNQDFDKKIKETQDNSKIEIDELNSNHEKELFDLKTQFEKQIEELNQKIKQLKNENSALEDEKTITNKKEQEIVNKITTNKIEDKIESRDIKKITNNKQELKTIEKLKSTDKKIVNEELEEQNDSISEKTNKNTQQPSFTHDNIKKQSEDKDLGYDSELNKLNIKSEKIKDDQEKILDSEKTDLLNEAEKIVNQIKSAATDDLKRLQDELKNKSIQMNSELEKYKIDLEQLKKAAKNDSNDKTELLISEKEKLLKTAEDKFATFKSNTDDKINSLQKLGLEKEQELLVEISKIRKAVNLNNKKSDKSKKTEKKTTNNQKQKNEEIDSSSKEPEILKKILDEKDKLISTMQNSIEDLKTTISDNVSMVDSIKEKFNLKSLSKKDSSKNNSKTSKKEDVNSKKGENK